MMMVQLQAFQKIRSVMFLLTDGSTGKNGQTQHDPTSSQGTESRGGFYLSFVLKQCKDMIQSVAGTLGGNFEHGKVYFVWDC